jgi:cation-transporting ATPase E
MHALLRFVLPATVLLAIAAFTAYVVVYFTHDINLLEQRACGAAAVTTLPATDQLARDALTYVMILGGLWLVVFAAPPNEFWAVVEPTTGDWRPTLVAVAMLGVYVLVLLVAPLRAFFGVHLLGLGEYLTIAAIVGYWALLLRLVWRRRLFDRFFGYLDPE